MRISEEISKHMTKAPIGLGLILLLLMAPPVVSAECGSTGYNFALYYVQHVQYEKFGLAIQSLEPALKTEPPSLKPLNLIGAALPRSGRIGSAQSYFRRGKQLNRQFFPALRNVAITKPPVKQTFESRKDFQQGLKHTSENETANLLLSEMDLAKQGCGSALGLFEKGQEQVVHEPELILRDGQCALEVGKRQEAITILDHVPPGDAKAQFRAGTLLARQGTYREAAKHFALAQQEGFHDLTAAEYNQVLMLIKAGDYSAAIREATVFISEGHKQADLFSLAGEAYLKEGEVNKAYESLRRATQLKPAEVGNYLDLAAICVQYSKYDLGLRIVNVGLHYAPNSYRLLVERGVMRIMKGELEHAERDFMKATKLAPRKALPYVALGNLWIEMGKNEKAVNLFREKEKSNPNNFMIEYLLGESLVRAGMAPDSSNESEAIDAFERSILLNPNYIEPRIQLGKLLLERGEVNHAIVELKKAAVLDPKNVGPVYLLAEAYRRKGNTAKAAELATRVNEMQTEDDEGSIDKAKARFRRILRDGISTFSSESADQ